MTLNFIIYLFHWKKKRNYKYYAQIKGLKLSALNHGVGGIPLVPMVQGHRKE